MPSDVCSSCGQPVQRTPSSRPEIICRECRWERRIAREAEQPKKSHHSRAEQERRAERKRQREAERANYVPSCGTRQGYDRHRANGEDCEQCRKAESARRAANGYTKRDKCTRCGKCVYRSHSSKGAIVCHECRRDRPEPRIFPVKRECGLPGCGNAFMVLPSSSRRYCSPACVGEANRTWTPEEARARKKAAYRARRMRVDATWDGITDEQILERDRWLCRMDQCLFGSRRIYKSRKFPDSRSPSIDHIIPLSLGGDDTQLNKRAAHLRCNVVRGAKPDEQMPLNFSLDPAIEIKPRVKRKPAHKPRPPKPCKTCGELLVDGKCDLHQPVYILECTRCNAPMASQKNRAKFICAACKTRPCAVPRCEEPVFFAATDWCAAHHHRHQKYGDVLASIPVSSRRGTRQQVAASRRALGVSSKEGTLKQSLPRTRASSRRATRLMEPLFTL